MNDDKLYKITDDLNNLLDIISEKTLKNQNFDDEFLKLATSLRWINTNLNKEDVLAFIDENLYEFEYGDVIVTLLQEATFQGEKFH